MDINTIKEFLENNEEIFNNAVEELDNYNGYLNDDRYYDMALIEDFFCDYSASDILDAGATGRDYICSHFRSDRNYFYFDVYGNLVSTDYKDYSDFLGEYFIKDLINNIDCLTLDDELTEMLEQYIEEAEQEG